MSSVQPVGRDVGDDSVALVSENQPEIRSVENTDTESVSVKVENPDSVSALVPNKHSSCFPKPLCYLFFALLFVCLSPVIYACVTAATVGILPLLLAIFIVVRLLQFVVRSENFENNFFVKLLLRYWMFVVVILLLVEAGLFYPIAKYVPAVQDIMIIGLPIAKWLKITCIVIGIYLLSQLIWVSLVCIIASMVTELDGRAALVLEAAYEIIGCLLFRWAASVVMSRVPTFKDSKIFDVFIYKWIEVFLYLLIGYNVITLLTHMFVWWLPKAYGDHLGISEKFKKATSYVCCDDLGNDAFNKKYIVFVACGIKRSIIFILSALMLLLTWVMYFSDHLNTKESKKFFRFGTWTLISILGCSFFWLIKSCILLYWEARAIYNRLHSKIQDIGKQLYIILLLTHTNYPDPIDRSEETSNDSTCCASSCINTAPKDETVQRTCNVYQTIDRKTIRRKLLNNNGSDVSVYGIQQAADQFLTTQYAYSKDSIPTYLNSDVEKNNIDELKLILEDEGQDYSNDDWELFRKLLSVGEKEEISFLEVKTWMERANNRCNYLANMLISEKEVVKWLNQFISGIIIVATIIIWFLLTDLATTNALVLIASPLVAASFIFGDTCKSLFQGLIFVYIVHPFDVGDLCVIDDKLMEVKRISVWSTIFSKVRTVGKKHDVIYPNSDLAIKNVINHKSEFDWNDRIEFTLSYCDDESTKSLKQEIEKYLDSDKQRFIPNFHSVEFLEIGDEDKIAIHIKYNVETEGWTNFECLKEKEKRRFDFALYIRNLINRHRLSTQTQQDKPADD